MVEAVLMFIEAVNHFNVPVYLLLRDHPKIILPDAPDQFKNIYREYRKALENLRVGQVVNSSDMTSDEVNAGADLVVGICSTMLVEACYLRKPVLSIWTAKIGQEFYAVAKNTFQEMPITNLGASFRAESVMEIVICLQKILIGDTLAMRQEQEKHFKADGLNGQRLAEAILRYY